MATTITKQEVLDLIDDAKRDLFHHCDPDFELTPSMFETSITKLADALLKLTDVVYDKE